MEYDFVSREMQVDMIHYMLETNALTATQRSRLEELLARMEGTVTPTARQ